MKLGVVSDTHGLLRPEVLPALTGVDRILHLGDVGRIEILAELAKIAPVTAIRGNVDGEGACARLSETEVVPVEDAAGGKHYLYMLHNVKAPASRPGGGEVCSRALRPHARSEFSHQEGRALFQSRLLRSTALRTAGDDRIARRKPLRRVEA